MAPGERLDRLLLAGASAPTGHSVPEHTQPLGLVTRQPARQSCRDALLDRVEVPAQISATVPAIWDA
jgi:hypothetical protein